MNFAASQITIRETRVMIIEVTIDCVVVDSKLAKKFTIDCVVSKIVCRHVNAIVKPSVNVIRSLSCLLNSCLKLWPPMKKLLIFCLIDLLSWLGLNSLLFRVFKANV